MALGTGLGGNGLPSGGGSGAVSSVFTRTGAVVAASADYTVAQVTGAAPLASPTFTGTVTVPTTVNTTDAAQKLYVDGVAAGLSIKPSVQEATTAGLPTYTYLTGVITVTATGTLTLDGQLTALGDRILVKNETAGNAPYNGIYTVTTAGASGVSAVLTRATDMNTGTQVPGAFAFVEKGTANSGTGWVVAGAGPYTIGVTAIAFTQFSDTVVIDATTGDYTTMAYGSSTAAGAVGKAADAGHTHGLAAIDATAGDIAQLGTGAAGSTGKVADAGHVHPSTVGGNQVLTTAGTWLSKSTNTVALAARTIRDPWLATSAIGESMTRFGGSLGIGTATPLVSGELIAVGLYFYAGDVVTNIAWTSGSTAGGTLTHWFFELRGTALTILGQTADQTSTAWAANTVKSLALTSAYTIPSTGVYYATLMVAATTVPNLLSASAGNAELDLAVAPSFADTAHTGITTPATSPTTMTNSAGSGPIPWVYTT